MKKVMEVLTSIDSQHKPVFSLVLDCPHHPGPFAPWFMKLFALFFEIFPIISTTLGFKYCTHYHRIRENITVDVFDFYLVGWTFGLSPIFRSPPSSNIGKTTISPLFG